MSAPDGNAGNLNIFNNDASYINGSGIALSGPSGPVGPAGPMGPQGVAGYGKWL